MCLLSAEVEGVLAQLQADSEDQEGVVESSLAARVVDLSKKVQHGQHLWGLGDIINQPPHMCIHC